MKFDNNSRVIEKIREIRTGKNIHQGDIANALNITVSAYNRIEKNKTQLTVNNLFIIAEVLEVRIEELLSLPVNHTFHNHNNTVMINCCKGELHITISEDYFKHIPKKAIEQE